MKTPVTFSVSYFIKAQKVKGNHVPILCQKLEDKDQKRNDSSDANEEARKA